jgi:hypothetical protein
MAFTFIFIEDHKQSCHEEQRNYDPIKVLQLVLYGIRFMSCSCNNW